MGHQIEKGRFSTHRGRKKAPKPSVDDFDSKTYFEYLFFRLGHLLPDREKFMTLATGMANDLKNALKATQRKDQE